MWRGNYKLPTSQDLEGRSLAEAYEEGGDDRLRDFADYLRSETNPRDLGYGDKIYLRLVDILEGK